MHTHTNTHIYTKYMSGKKTNSIKETVAIKEFRTLKRCLK